MPDKQLFPTSLTRRALAASSLALAAGTARAQGRDDGERRFTILHTNDLHGGHVPIDVAPGDATAQTGDPGREHSEFERPSRIGGFATLAGAVAARRAALGLGRVLVVDGGDTFSDDLLGNLTKGEAMIRLERGRLPVHGARQPRFRLRLRAHPRSATCSSRKPTRPDGFRS